MLKKIILLCLCMPLAVQATDLKEAPRCNDKRVIEVLSSAFAKQGEATGVNMAVSSVLEIKEISDYPAKKIRQCIGEAYTASGRYSVNYSIAVQGEQFFVQAENVYLISNK